MSSQPSILRQRFLENADNYPMDDWETLRDFLVTHSVPMDQASISNALLTHAFIKDRFDIFEQLLEMGFSGENLISGCMLSDPRNEPYIMALAHRYPQNAAHFLGQMFGNPKFVSMRDKLLGLGHRPLTDVVRDSFGNDKIASFMLTYDPAWVRSAFAHPQARLSSIKLVEALVEAGISFPCEAILKTCFRDSEYSRNPDRQQIAERLMPQLAGRCDRKSEIYTNAYIFGLKTNLPEVEYFEIPIVPDLGQRLFSDLSTYSDLQRLFPRCLEWGVDVNLPTSLLRDNCLRLPQIVPDLLAHGLTIPSLFTSVAHQYQQDDRLAPIMWDIFHQNNLPLNACDNELLFIIASTLAYKPNPKLMEYLTVLHTTPGCDFGARGGLLGFILRKVPNLPFELPIYLPRRPSDQTKLSLVDNFPSKVDMPNRSWEDDHMILTGTGRIEWIYAVFDGHGSKLRPKDRAQSGKIFTGDKTYENVNHTVYAAMYGTADVPSLWNFLEAAIGSTQEIEHAIENAFIDFDRYATYYDCTGGTCVTIILKIDGDIYTVNLGDSRTLLVDGDTLVWASTDHEPNHPDELKRIEAAGGQVYRGRIDHYLSLSRSLGDAKAKRNGFMPYDPYMGRVCARPDVVKHSSLSPTTYAILTSDAPYTVGTDFTSEDIVTLATHFGRDPVQMGIAIAPFTTDDLTILCVNDL